MLQQRNYSNHQAMKRLFTLLFVMLSVTINSRAQSENTHDEDDGEQKKVAATLRIPTGAGNMMVGANLLFTRAEFQKGFEANYSGGISPKAAFFLLPNIALGLSLDLNVEGHTGYSAISYGISPFARLYFAHDNTARTRPFQFFVEGGVGFGGTNSRYDVGGITTKATTNGARLYILPGVDYFINNHIAAEAGLQYLFISGKPDAHIIGLNVGFQIFLGR